MMGITGVLINHPSLLREITVPAVLLPEIYRYTDWRPLHDNRLLVGSFSGLYIWDRQKQQGRDLLGNPLPAGHNIGRIRSGWMASGAAVYDGQPLFWADYRKGIQILNSKMIPGLPMPHDVENSGISLWHFLFECHNGRIFRPILGKYTWLVVPLGGLFLLVSVLTGSYDWFFRKVLVRKRNRTDFRERG
jgi:hypothetical protein